jgi:hypothetical protein
VRAENRVFGAARAAEKTVCQRRWPGFFLSMPYIYIYTEFVNENVPNIQKKLCFGPVFMNFESNHNSHLTEAAQSQQTKNYR